MALARSPEVLTLRCRALAAARCAGVRTVAANEAMEAARLAKSANLNAWQPRGWMGQTALQDYTSITLI